MGRKTFVASAAEEAQKPNTEEAVAGPSKEKKDKKRSRDDNGKGGNGSGKGWKRDPEIASKYTCHTEATVMTMLMKRGDER
jgi:hypothetical protein